MRSATATPAKARLIRGIATAAILLLTILPITDAAEAGPGGGGGGRGGRFGGHVGVSARGFAGRGGGLGFVGGPVGGSRISGRGFATTVASGHATLATKRTLLLNLGRTSTGWIAPACGWRTHSITSSAIASNVAGMVSASVIAVLRLSTSSNFVDWCTGMSMGFLPLRIRPVKSPTT